jgi:hypothetical protein
LIILSILLLLSTHLSFFNEWGNYRDGRELEQADIAILNQYFESQLGTHLKQQYWLIKATGILCTIDKDFHRSQEALQYAKQRLDIGEAMFRPSASPRGLSVATNHLGHALIFVDELEEARKHIERTTELRKASPDLKTQCTALILAWASCTASKDNMIKPRTLC